MQSKAIRLTPFREYTPAPELRFYRAATIRLLRRYFRMSLAAGRLPNIMGRECFRAKLSGRSRLSGFEDAIILITDVERCIDRLEVLPQQLIARCILQEHNQEAAASLCGCPLRTLQRRLPDAVDQVSELFLATGLLPRMTETAMAAESACQSIEKAARRSAEKSCQEGEEGDLPVSA